MRPAWNPVRLNRQGTLELRGMDSKFPEVTLTVAALVLGAANRVRWDDLDVVPDERVNRFEVAGGALLVPGFGLLGGKLLYAAATRGLENPRIVAYLDSILEFAAGDHCRLAGQWRHRRAADRYPTTEAEIL